MKSFIHTFSFNTYIHSQERMQIESVYSNSLTWISDENNWIITAYNKYGVLIKISNNSKPEKQYDKNHYAYKVMVIINLYKLCYPAMNYGMITEQSDINTACMNLEKIFCDIERQTGVNLIRNGKIKRIDIAKDVITPSEDYTHEIIRLSNLAVKKRGYKRWEPEGKIKSKWRLENSSMFYSVNDDIKSKLYNKKQDLLDHAPNEDLGSNGLLRFEVSLKRPALKKLGYISDSVITTLELSQILYNLTCDGDKLLERFVADALHDGSMISKRLQDKYISMQYDGKNHRINNMKLYRKELNTKGFYNDWDYDKMYRLQEHFDKLNLSPLYTQPSMPYIPSFRQLLKEEVDTNLLRYCANKTKDKNAIMWNHTQNSSLKHGILE